MTNKVVGFDPKNVAVNKMETGRKKPAVAKPVAPKHLGGDLRKEWLRVADNLHAQNAYLPMDADTIERYVVFWLRRKDLMGTLALGDDCMATTRQLIAVESQLNKLADALLMSPKARGTRDYNLHKMNPKRRTKGHGRDG